MSYIVDDETKPPMFIPPALSDLIRNMTDVKSPKHARENCRDSLKKINDYLSLQINKFDSKNEISKTFGSRTIKRRGILG